MIVQVCRYSKNYIISDNYYSSMMTSWGSDLWDSYSSVVEYVTTGTSNLVDVYAKYVKEKADLDKEYAKGLRKLIAKYEPKKIQDGEETTEISSFR